METLDWGKLTNDLSEDKQKIPYEENKHRFRKVAFDVFQLNSSPSESLWSLEDDEDGKQYLVALYQSDENKDNIDVKSEWKALADKEAQNITLTYKDMPIQRFAAKDYGFDKEDVHVFQKSLLDLLNSNPEHVSKMLRAQSKEKIRIIAKHFPELRQFIG